MEMLFVCYLFEVFDYANVIKVNHKGGLLM